VVPPRAPWLRPGLVLHGLTPSPGAISSNFLTTGNLTYCRRTFRLNWANFAENSAAPMPFRVNAAGNTVAIIGGSTAATGVSGTTTFLKRQIYTDYFDSTGSTFAFNPVGTATRRYMPPTRLAGVIRGEENADQGYQRPTTQLEIWTTARPSPCHNASTQTWLTT
jgi:hypothetical protein